MIWKWRMEYTHSSPDDQYFGTALAAWTRGNCIVIAAQPSVRIHRDEQSDVGLTHWSMLRIRNHDEPNYLMCRMYAMQPSNGLPPSVNLEYAQRLLNMAKPAPTDAQEEADDPDWLDVWPDDWIEAREVGYIDAHAIPPNTMTPDVAEVLTETDEDWSFSLDVHLLEAKQNIMRRALEIPLDKVASNQPIVNPLQEWSTLWDRRWSLALPGFQATDLRSWEYHAWKPLNIMSRLLKTDGNAYLFSGHRRNKQSMEIERKQNDAHLYTYDIKGRIDVDAELWGTMSSTERKRVIRANRTAIRRKRRVSESEANKLTAVAPKEK